MLTKRLLLSIGNEWSNLNKIFHSQSKGDTQWENISITSMEEDFWGVKSSGCENSHATEVKYSNIPQKS
jgi:hypothetical protein